MTFSSGLIYAIDIKLNHTSTKVLNNKYFICCTSITIFLYSIFKITIFTLSLNIKMFT